MSKHNPKSDSTCENYAISKNYFLMVIATDYIDRNSNL